MTGSRDAARVVATVSAAGAAGAAVARPTSTATAVIGLTATTGVGAPGGAAGGGGARRSRRQPLAAISVVVPARDEAALIGDCLTALDRAAARSPLPVRVWVVADACTDDTAERAAAAGATVLVRSAEARPPGVGAARAAGLAAALAEHTAAGVPAAAVLLACTDADTTVDRHWLARAVRLADAGADVLVGAVRLPDGSALTEQWRAGYPLPGGRAGRRHSHVHGANLLIRGSGYLQAGGVPALTCGEDHALLARLRAVGCRVCATTALTVTTSDRQRSRVTGGFADVVARWAVAG